jgi:rhamnosyltransferase
VWRQPQSDVEIGVGYRGDRMRISVVLLTYNGEDTLRQVVAVLRRQDIAAEVEYVAVDSGSADGTRELLEAAGFAVYTIDSGGFSFGPVREYAFQRSTGDIIVTQSQDVVPLNETYLRVMTGPIVNGEAAVVQGMVRVPAEDDRVFLWDRLGRMNFTREGLAFIRKYGNIGLSCACLAISREAWKATGFGDAPYCEDKFIQKRLAESHFRIVGSSGAVAWHGHAYSLSSLVKRCLNEGVGWRYVGVRYTLRSCLRDLSAGFTRHLPVWWSALWSGKVNSVASLFFFQIRPLCLWIGNRILKRVVL